MASLGKTTAAATSSPLVAGAAVLGKPAASAPKAAPAAATTAIGAPSFVLGGGIKPPAPFAGQTALPAAAPAPAAAAAAPAAPKGPTPNVQTPDPSHATRNLGTISEEQRRTLGQSKTAALLSG